MKAFDMSTISQPSKLFGRELLLERLRNLAKRNDNVQIIGSRRFGKTCMMRCMETMLREEPAVFPIYIDMKADAIRGTENVYRYLIAVLVEHLCSERIFTQPEIINRVEITPSNDWTDVFDELQNISLVKTQKVFSELVCMFAEMMEKNILFMFDEYEFMFKYGFDRPEGFMKLRTLSTTTLPSGIHPFSFWIAGSQTWDVFSTLIGSGELNVINTTEYIFPLSYEEFSAMWKYECDKIEDIGLRNLISNSSKKAFDCSGGVPFYAKQIGSNFINQGVFPGYQILSTYFSEIDSSLHPDEKKILNELRKAPKNYPQSNFITDLEIHGLIVLDKKTQKFSVPIGFYLEHLKAIQQDKILLVTPASITLGLVKEITDLVENINNTCYNKKKAYMFMPVNDGASLEHDLRTVCTSKEQFTDFCSALYRYYFERSKGENCSGEKLPTQYQRSEFHKIVDICRHTFGGGHELDTFNAYSGQLTKAQALKRLVGTENEPYKAEEFIALQAAMLRMFIVELNSINSCVRK